MTKRSIFIHVGVILAGLVGVILAANPYAILPDTRQSRVEQTLADFLAFYAAGRLAWESPSDLYDAERQADVQSQAFGAPITPDGPGFMPFAYPPIVALPFIPLAWLSYTHAYLAMVALNILLWAAAACLVCRRFSLSSDATTVFVFASSLSFPILFTVLNGQLAFVTFTLAALAIADLREGKSSAGLWIGMLAVKPTLVPLFFAWIVIHRQGKAIRMAMVTSATLAALSITMIGPSGIHDYIAISSQMARHYYGSANPDWMPNLFTLLAAIGVSPLGKTVAVMAFGLLFVFAARQHAYAALIAGALVLNPHVHLPDLTLLWIPAVLWLARHEGERIAGWATLAGSILATVAVFKMGTAQIPLLAALLLAVFIGSAFGGALKKDLTTTPRVS